MLVYNPQMKTSGSRLWHQTSTASASRSIYFDIMEPGDLGFPQTNIWKAIF